MSLLVLPSIQNPPQVSFTWPIKQSPYGKTLEQKAATGRSDVRIPLMQYPRWKFEWDLGYIKGDATMTNSAWQILLNFYLAVQFGAADWYFLHPFDNTIPNTSPYQIIGTGDGTTTEFYMYRSLVALGAQDLIQNFVSAPDIYVNNVLQSGGSYTINQYGTLTFNTAPPASENIAWSGQFYYRCHFLEDTWGDLDEFLYQVWEMKSLKFESCLL